MHLLLSLLALALIAGCSTSEGSRQPADALADPATHAQAAEAPGPHSSRIEQLARQIDRGERLPAARSELERLLADASLSSTDRAAALLELSRAAEALGDKEAAVVAVEQILSSRSDEPPWQLAPVEARLQRLLTGRESSKPRAFARPPAAPVARVLARYLQLDKDGPPTGLWRIGLHPYSHETLQLGSFNFLEADPPGAPTRPFMMRFDPSWTALVRNRDEAQSHLLVLSFDLEDNRVPARYDAFLPLPSEQLAGELARGKGLIAARERPGALPTIVLAAPHGWQLGAVERAFAALTELPLTPVSVEVPSEAPELTQAPAAPPGPVFITTALGAGPGKLPSIAPMPFTQRVIRP